jgi:hypothetical protein
MAFADAASATAAAAAAAAASDSAAAATLQCGILPRPSPRHLPAPMQRLGERQCVQRNTTAGASAQRDGRLGGQYTLPFNSANAATTAPQPQQQRNQIC